MNSNASSSHTGKKPEQRQGLRVLREIYDWADALATATVLVILLLTFVFRVIGVEGNSMVPTLQWSDRVLLNQLFYTPQEGDVVVVNQPNYFGKPLVKRIIAMGGDEIDIDYETGTVYVNGQPLEEPYLGEQMRPQLGDDVKLPMTVPPGYVFVMGDNRNASTDSRSSLVGCIEEGYVMGKVVLRLYPLNNIGLIS